MSDLFSSLKISGSGLSVNRRKMNVTAENIANANTTKTNNGGPYRKKTVLVSGKSQGIDFNTELQRHRVKLNRTSGDHLKTNRQYGRHELDIVFPQSREAVDSKGDFKMVYDPAHPDANADGWVEMPDINIIVEMVNMMTAARAYEANASTLEATKNIYQAALDI
jgi:flagellar basal-body rod protein FlgC